MKDSLLYISFGVKFAIKNRTFSHFKQYKRWYRDKKSGETTLSLGMPWITYDAIDFLEEICNSKTRVFEWGSGGATLFFALRCKEVVSVEHDTFWLESLEEKLKEVNLNNVTLKGIKPEPIANFYKLDPYDPDNFISKNRKSKELTFEKYVKSIDKYDKEYFDIVVVDGRARIACIKRAIPHIKKGGYLIVDNSNRKRYLSPFPNLNNPDEWKKTEFVGPVFFQHAFSKTTMFKKLT